MSEPPQDGILDLLLRSNEATGEKLPGELIPFGVQLPTDLDYLILLGLSDVHRGNPYSATKHFLRTLSLCDADPHVYIFFNGDLCEASIRTSKGEIFRQVGSPEEQRDWMIDKLKPYQSRIIGMTRGNHEDRIANECGIDIIKDIAKALNVPYRPEGMLLKIIFGQGNEWHPDKPYSYWLYATHGYGGARTKSAKATKVERTSTWVHADVYMMSHDHVVNIAPDTYLMPDERLTLDKDSGFLRGSIHAKRKMLVKTNAFLKWGGYSESLGFPPVDLTVPLVYLAGKGKPVVRAIA